MPIILNGPNRYAAVDKRYTTSARTVTIKRFGPSESLKNTNNILEQVTAVTAKIINEVLFDLKYKFPVLMLMSITCNFLMQFN
jgi:hypothetical protein